MKKIKIYKYIVKEKSTQNYIGYCRCCDKKIKKGNIYFYNKKEKLIACNSCYNQLNNDVWCE
jgi:hypothetical protein